MQKHTPWGLHTRMYVYLRMAEGHRDQLEHLLDARVHPAEVREARRGRRVVPRGRRR